MPIPRNVIEDLHLKKAQPPKKKVTIIVEEHQIRINIPAEISEAMKIKKGDEMELTFEGKDNDTLIGKLLRHKK